MNQTSESSRLLRQGFQALEAGDHHKAADFCRRVLAVEPKKVEAHFLVGLVAAEMKDLRTAVRGFGTVTKLDPKHAAGWAQLARTFIRLGQMIRAENALAQAVQAGSDDPFVHDMIGLVYSLLGDQRSAKEWYRRAHKKAPGEPSFGVNLATALTYLGETEDATNVLSELVSKNDDNAQAQWLLSSLHQAEGRARPDHLLKKACATKFQPAKAFFAYAAGKEYEDCGEWGEAFAAFDMGARAKRATVKYDEAAEDEMYDALVKTFSADWASDQREGCEDPAPIFVVGQPRTGTTLIERIITSHADVEAAGELQQFGLSVRRMSKTGDGARWSATVVRASTSINPKDLGREYLRASAPMLGAAPRFVDKLPGNFLHIPLILKALPNAHIVHLTRNPMDSCFASFKQLFAEAYYHSYDQAEMARHFARYARLMAHWRKTFPGRFLDVSYEETVSDLEPNARRLIEFLGLEWQDACLDFHDQKSSVATASAVQVREKAHTRSIDRWRRYERRLTPMRKALEAAGIEVGS